MQKRRIVKIILFLLILFVLFMNVEKVFKESVGDQAKYPQIVEFFDEREESLDAVFIGSSSTFAFWQAPIAWEKYGITVRCMASNTQPLVAARYLIEDGLKTQPDAVYVVAINTMHETVKSPAIHYLVDKYPFSMTKAKMIFACADYGEIPWSERLEFFFPIIRYHNRWSELGEQNFNNAPVGLKGGSTYKNFLEVATDVTEEYTVLEEKAAKEELPYDTLVELLEFCKENEVKVLFVTNPQVLKSEKRLKKYNAANELIESYGFDTLNTIPMIPEIGMDLATDYYNGSHTNVHGSLKYTLWLGNYLKDKYGFTDKRSDGDYADWEQESSKYMKIIKPYLSEEEYKRITE
ncbi:MAG: hypothetical protein IKY23_05645 [Lachnospiraceae bacterium]|nr:hypothetical protein [Lachnospiraceae bacterium]